MRVVLVDDDRMSLDVLAAMLRGVGCEVQAYQNPSSALAHLPPDVDLVISDVGMPEMDGFTVAEGVALRLGVCPPRTLLVSGESHTNEVEQFPPSKVIGLLPKPIMFADVGRIVGFLAQTRKCCPGLKAPLCPYACGRSGECESKSAEGPASCEGVEYARCPHYDAVCGKTLRLWVSGGNRATAAAG